MVPRKTLHTGGSFFILVDNLARLRYTSNIVNKTERKMQTNCTALAKIVKNKKLKTLRIVFTFDLYSNKITVKNAAYTTGDICDITDANADLYIAQAVKNAKDMLRCNNIVVVD
jgi:methyl coenzyme M reductase subunit C-like uncharacterized protein (methanogenesis marker protein 7)